MREKGKDELSALMDGEATELELHRILRTLSDDPDQAAKWQRYHLVSAVLKKEIRPGSARTMARLDVASRVSAALAEEPALQATSSTAASPTIPGRKIDGWWRPMANVAIAASVATVVVLGWQQHQVSAPSLAPALVHATQPTLPQAPATASAIPVVASLSTSADGGPSTGLPSTVASYSTSTTTNYPVTSYPATNYPATSYPVANLAVHGAMPRSVTVPVEYVRAQKLDEQRFNHYLISHSGNAAFATQRGPLPYVRIVTLKPTESLQR